MPSNASSPVSILLVEDEENTRTVLASMLARKYPEITLYCASGGQTGLELFAAHRPDLVITDINMPGMGGVKMIDQIRTMKPGTRFIILTGDTGKLELERSVGNGFEFDHFIVKPISMKNLFAAIDRCLSEIADE